MLAKPSQAKLSMCMAFALICTVVGAQESPLQQPWHSQNRYLELGAGQQQQAYREQDSYALTPDGVLNSESGRQDALHIAVRWQAPWGGFAAVQAQRQSGPTAYKGYLQSGSGALTPYNATTGNTASHVALQLGYAMGSQTLAYLPANWEIIPVVWLGQHTWQRNLAQYSESYRYTTQALGAVAQYQLRLGTVVEAQALRGKSSPASVSVPGLDFDATQPGGIWVRWQLGVSQDLGAATGQDAWRGWRVFARTTSTRTTHGASDVTNGLQAPPNESTPNIWLLGLQKQF